MRKIVLLLSISLTCFANIGQAQYITSLSALQDCIGENGPALGYGSVCQLDFGDHPVLTPLVIQRPVTIRGRLSSGRWDTRLRRGSASMMYILYSDRSLSTVNVEDLTIDGNRFGLGPSFKCLPANAAYYDLDLTGVSYGKAVSRV